MTDTPHGIDVHHHILPPEYVGALAGIGVSGGGGIPFPAWSAAEALAMMDRQDIALVVTSVSSPGVHFGDAAFARELARRCNDASASLVTPYPARFGAFATLPLPDVDGTLRELEHDTALSANPHALRSLCELVGPSQILFGSDFPFAPEPVTQASIDGLAAFDGFDAAARRLIERDNALALLPTLRRNP